MKHLYIALFCATAMSSVAQNKLLSYEEGEVRGTIKESELVVNANNLTNQTWTRNSYGIQTYNNIGINGNAQSNINIYSYMNTLNSSAYNARFDVVSNTTTNGSNYPLLMYVNNSQHSIASGVTDNGYRIAWYCDGFINNAGFQGTLANQYGINLSAGIGLGTGTINNAYGIRSVMNLSSGTIGNMYALYLNSANTTGGTLTGSRYDVFAAATSAANYFAGRVGIGLLNPTAAFDVGGVARFRSFVEMPPNSDFAYNAYYGTGAWRYRQNGFAADFYQRSDGHITFLTAPSGTADAAITYAARMTILNGGGLELHGGRVTGMAAATGASDAVTLGQAESKYVQKSANINAYGQFLENTSPNGYGVKIKNGNNNNASITIANAMNSSDAIHLYGDGRAVFNSTVTVGNATSAEHALNRATADTRYMQCKTEALTTLTDAAGSVTFDAETIAQKTFPFEINASGGTSGNITIFVNNVRDGARYAFRYAGGNVFFQNSLLFDPSVFKNANGTTIAAYTIGLARTWLFHAEGTILYLDN